LAVNAGKTNLVKFLIEQWPEALREKNYALQTPLHQAISSSWKLEVVRLVVDGWDEAVREKDRAGNTPLHLAAMFAATEVVRILVKLWPDGLKAGNNHGLTPFLLYERYLNHSSTRRNTFVSDIEKKEMLSLLSVP
jgi:ankyrin repeat protein